jgi:hypothetical protein
VSGMLMTMQHAHTALCTLPLVHVQLQEGAARLPPVTVYATSKAHIEVVEVAPRLQPLHELLAERPYSSEEEEGTQGPGAQPQCVGDDTSMACDQGGTGQGCYTLDQLLERVQVRWPVCMQPHAAHQYVHSLAHSLTHWPTCD